MEAAARSSAAEAFFMRSAAAAQQDPANGPPTKQLLTQQQQQQQQQQVSSLGALGLSQLMEPAYTEWDIHARPPESPKGTDARQAMGVVSPSYPEGGGGGVPRYYQSEDELLDSLRARHPERSTESLRQLVKSQQIY